MPIIKVAQYKPEYMTIKAARNRFTLEEKIAIEAETESSPLVRTFIADMNTSRYIDRFDPQFISCLEALEDAGLIAEGRAEEIYTTPVANHERYKP